MSQLHDKAASGGQVYSEPGAAGKNQLPLEAKLYLLVLFTLAMQRIMCTLLTNELRHDRPARLYRPHSLGI